MSKRTVAALSILALVGGLSLGADGHTLSGSLSRSGIADGTRGYLKLIAKGETCGDARELYSEMVTFYDGKATYSIEGVPSNDYEACGHIDVNSRGGDRPDSGDLTAHTWVRIGAGDSSLHLSEGSWREVP
jgi:hypothetical protein